MKKIWFVFIVALALFLFSAYQIFHILSEYKEGENVYEEVKSEYRETVAATVPSEPVQIPDGTVSSPEETGETEEKGETEETEEIGETEETEETEAVRLPDYSDYEHEKELTLLHTTFNYILVPQYIFDFEKLLQLNSEVKGWILIDGTHIDYPIVQAPDNDYYLRRTIDLTPNNAGSIFIDYRNQEPFAQNNTIIYGHNQRNGQMFHDLVLYQDEEFLRTHPYVHIYTTDGRHSLYEVYSMYVTEEDSLTYWLNFSDPAFFAEYLEYTRSSSTIPSSISLTPEDKILTLSTCTNELDTERMVIHARYVTTIQDS